MGLWRATLKDARGRVVSLVRHETLLPGITDPERRERLMRAGAASPALSWAEKRRFVLIFLAFLPLIVALAALPPFLMRHSPWWGILMFVPGALVPVTMTIYVMRRAVPQRLAEAYLRAKLCASCAYDLTDTPPGADALTTCPECGAAWNLAPYSQSEPRA